MDESPPSSRTAEAVPVRDRLLNAAEQVVAREGVSHLTLDAVAKEAGVSKGGLLYHFPSKSALVVSVVHRLADRCECEHAAALEGTAHEPGAFARAFLRVRCAQMDPSEAPLLTALVAAAGVNPEYLQPFREYLARWQQRLEQDGIDPADAMIVRLAAEGLAWARFVGAPVPEGERLAAVLKRLEELTRPKQPATIERHSANGSDALRRQDSETRSQ